MEPWNKNPSRNGISLPANNLSESLENSKLAKEAKTQLESNLTIAEKCAYTTPSQVLLRNALLPMLQRISDDLFYRIVMQEEVLVAHNGYSHHPDFFFPGGRLVIEVDGPIHDREVKMKLDPFIEVEIYEALGIWVYRIRNEQIQSGILPTLLRDIESYLRKVLLSEKAQAQLVAVKLCQGRRAYLDANPSKRQGHQKKIANKSTRKPRFYQSHAKWGGTETIIAPSVNSKVGRKGS